jgi:hypothetical protein
MPWDTMGGQFQPPAVVNDAESLVCNDSDNEKADVNPPPHLFYDNSNPAADLCDLLAFRSLTACSDFSNFV